MSACIILDMDSCGFNDTLCGLETKLMSCFCFKPSAKTFVFQHIRIRRS